MTLLPIEVGFILNLSYQESKMISNSFLFEKWNLQYDWKGTLIKVHSNLSAVSN